MFSSPLLLVAPGRAGSKSPGAPGPEADMPASEQLGLEASGKAKE